MPRKKNKKDKRKRGKAKSPPPKVEEENEVEAMPEDDYARLGRVLGTEGWQPGPATLPKDVHIDNFRMLDPGGGRYLLDKTAIKINEGSKYALVGKNGAGKTTLLNHLSSYDMDEFPK